MMTPIFPGTQNLHKGGSTLLTHKNHHERNVILLSVPSGGLSLQKL